MTSALYAILAILLFGLLVGIHEFGHFAAAKACGVKVLEFSLGMGPALFQKTLLLTPYSDGVSNQNGINEEGMEKIR